MNNITGLRFYVNEDLNLVVDDHREKTVKYKVISLHSFCKLVKNSVEVTDVQTGILPEGCVSYRESRDGNKFVVLELGSERMDLKYEKTVYPDFPVPRLLYGFFLSKENKIQRVHVAVADMGTLRENTKLYKYPFSNVAGFSLCIGQNSMPKVKSLRQLGSIPHYIFSMPDNNDRYSPDRTRLGLEYRTLLETLKDKTWEYYYTDVLIPNGKTLADFIQG